MGVGVQGASAARVRVRAQVGAPLPALRVCAGSCSSASRQHEQVAWPRRARGVCPVPGCLAQPRRLVQSERQPSAAEQAAGTALGTAGTSAPGGRAGGRERAARTRSRCAGLQHPPLAVLPFGFGCFLGHLRAVLAGPAEPEAAGCGDVRCLARHTTARNMGEPALLQPLPSCAPALRHRALLVLGSLRSLSGIPVIGGRPELYLPKAFAVRQYASATQPQTREVWRRAVSPSRHSSPGTEALQGAPLQTALPGLPCKLLTRW